MKISVLKEKIEFLDIGNNNYYYRLSKSNEIAPNIHTGYYYTTLTDYEKPILY